MVAASFTVTPELTGYTYSTTFSCTNTSFISGTQLHQYVWNFGDGGDFYSIKHPIHAYNYPGIYTISLTAYGLDGTSDTFSTAVSVNAFHQDSITFTQQPNDIGTPGVLSPVPFIVNVVSTNINQPLNLQLYAANSHSAPYEFAPSKWSFLTPTWYFTDSDRNIITNLKISSTPIYDNQNIQNGVSGVGIFYYKDDLPCNNLDVIVTLQTSAFSDPVGTNINYYPSYSNTTVSASASWQIRNPTPNTLRITGNYIDTITPYKWINVPIPIMITLHDVIDETTSGILFNYPQTNEEGYSHGLTLSAYDESGNNIPCIFDTTQRFQQTTSDNIPTGGYIFTTVTPLATGTNVRFVASTLTTTGTSTPFNIINFTETYNALKINQNFNMAGYMESLALPDILSQNIEMFKPFLGAVAGNSQLSASPDIGQTIYEKIANFTGNIADIDTCGVSQLLSLANMVDAPASKFATFYPADIESVLNIASTPINKLYGNIDLQFIEPDTTDLTRRYPLDTTTAFVTAGTKIALQSIYQSNLQYVTVPLGPNDTNIYPLSSFDYPGLIPPILQHYKFYAFKPVYAGSYSTIIADTSGNTLSAFNDLTYGQADLLYNTFVADTWYNPYTYNITIQHTKPSFVNNTIDWNNPLTTLSPLLSTADDLYKDNGIVEAMFNYFLTKNLFYNVG
jgi:PKD repeat protein